MSHAAIARERVVIATPPRFGAQVTPPPGAKGANRYGIPPSLSTKFRDSIRAYNQVRARDALPSSELVPRATPRRAKRRAIASTSRVS